jgi:hypothetical protein
MRAADLLGAVEIRQPAGDPQHGDSRVPSDAWRRRPVAA